QMSPRTSAFRASRAEADLLDLDLVRPENLARSADRVIFGMVEAADKVCVESDLWSEEFRVPHSVLIARGAVEPVPVGVCKRNRRLRLFGFCGIRRRGSTL